MNVFSQVDVDTHLSDDYASAGATKRAIDMGWRSVAEIRGESCGATSGGGCAAALRRAARLPVAETAVAPPTVKVFAPAHISAAVSLTHLPSQCTTPIH